MEVISMLMAGIIFIATVTAPAAFTHGTLALTLTGAYLLGTAVTAGAVKAAYDHYGDDVFLGNEGLNCVFIVSWPISWPLWIVYLLGYWAVAIF